jgi:four helix bundle protein
LRQDAVTTPLIGQFVSAGTSIGSNYREADNAESRKDLHHKICICRKEADETKYWIEMIVTAQPASRAGARTLWQEAKELHLIFCSIADKTR